MAEPAYDPSLYVDVRPCPDGRVDLVLVTGDGETHVVLSPDAARAIAHKLAAAAGSAPVTLVGTF